MVSDCCQSAHLPDCRAGTSRWFRYTRRGRAGKWDQVQTIEDKATLRWKTGPKPWHSWQSPTPPSLTPRLFLTQFTTEPA